MEIQPEQAKRKSKINYDDFCDILNYRFRKVVLLKLALTHASFTKNRLENNQRLEFLGDRVLGLSVAALLYENYPLEDEGALAIRHAGLASTKTLAMVADTIRISDLLELSRQEIKRKGFKNRNILADSMEALLGAIYIDSDFETAFKIIKRFWTPHIQKSIAPIKDCKTKLQEYMQKKYNAQPTYELVGKAGPAHAPTFTMTSTVEDITETHTGTSKKEVEQIIAAHILKHLGLLTPEQIIDLETYVNDLKKINQDQD